MTRPLFFGLTTASATLFLAAPAIAGPHLLPRIHLPKINLGKAVGAASYPVTKSMLNGGKTVLKTAATAASLGALPSVGPPGVNTVAKKVIISIGRR